MLTLYTHGKFKKTNSFLQRMLELADLSWLDKYGKKGVEALKANTPKDTGLLADSWYYEISHDSKGATLHWKNSDIEGGANVAILIQYGHGTRGGSYVQGIDYINPALGPIFEEIVSEIREEVKRR